MCVIPHRVKAEHQGNTLFFCGFLWWQMHIFLFLIWELGTQFLVKQVGAALRSRFLLRQKTWAAMQLPADPSEVCSSFTLLNLSPQAWLCVLDPEDGGLAGGGALQGRPSGGIAQRGDDGGTESCCDWAFPRGQRKGAGDHKRLCQR